MCKRSQHQQRVGLLGTFDSEAVPHVKTLFRVATYLVRDRGDAEDLVQETFMQALQSFHRFEPGANCRAWLVAIMYSVERTRHREFSTVH